MNLNNLHDIFNYCNLNSIDSQICGIQLDEILVYQDNTLADSYTVQELTDVITSKFFPRLRRPTFDNIQVVDVR